MGHLGGQLVSSSFAFELGLLAIEEPSYFYYNISEEDFKNAVYIKTDGVQSWSIPLSGVFVKDVQLNFSEAVIDTGTSITVLPTTTF
jgi:hypothetical protein